MLELNGKITNILTGQTIDAYNLFIKSTTTPYRYEVDIGFDIPALNLTPRKVRTVEYILKGKKLRIHFNDDIIILDNCSSKVSLHSDNISKIRWTALISADKFILQDTYDYME